MAVQDDKGSYCMFRIWELYSDSQCSHRPNEGMSPTVCSMSQPVLLIHLLLLPILKVLPHYPMIIGVGQALERRVDRVHKEEKEKRPDLYALAMGYSGLLKSRKSQWLAEQDFHYVPPVSRPCLITL